MTKLNNMKLVESFSNGNKWSYNKKGIKEGDLIYIYEMNYWQKKRVVGSGSDWQKRFEDTV